MGASDLLRSLHDAGFMLALAASNGIRVTPSGRLTDAQRKEIRDHRADLLKLLASTSNASPMPRSFTHSDVELERDTARLIGAINACCDERGDDPANRAALIAEIAGFAAAEQRDLVEHFAAQAQLWRDAHRGIAP